MGTYMQSSSVLQSNEISEPDGGESDERIVNRIKEAPTLLTLVHDGPASYDESRSYPGCLKNKPFFLIKLCFSFPTASKNIKQELMFHCYVHIIFYEILLITIFTKMRSNSEASGLAQPTDLFIFLMMTENALFIRSPML